MARADQTHLLAEVEWPARCSASIFSRHASLKKKRPLLPAASQGVSALAILAAAHRTNICQSERQNL
jgi:hypothetical protein